jgi:uncharacterized Ntn-hydrolase superfamily protein
MKTTERPAGAHGRRGACCIAAFLFCTPVILSSGTAGATWSIAAVDGESGEVGAAGASCAFDVWTIAGLSPGRGVVVAQARVNMTAREQAVGLLAAGAGPDRVLAALTDPDFDASYQSRQYGAAVLGDGVAAGAFTGAETTGVAADGQGVGVTVQGNCLASEEVVAAALAAYGKAAGRKDLSLSDRLLAALEAGSRAGGDARCGEKRSLSAFVAVSRPADERAAPYLSLKVRSAQDAVPLLRRNYETWKKNMEPVNGTVAGIMESPDSYAKVVLAGVLQAESFPGAIVFNDGTGRVEVHFDDLAKKEDIVLPAVRLPLRRYLLFGSVGRYADGKIYVRFEDLHAVPEEPLPLPAAHGES